MSLQQGIQEIEQRRTQQRRTQQRVIQPQQNEVVSYSEQVRNNNKEAVKPYLDENKYNITRDSNNNPIKITSKPDEYGITRTVVTLNPNGTIDKITKYGSTKLRKNDPNRASWVSAVYDYDEQGNLRLYQDYKKKDKYSTDTYLRREKRYEDNQFVGEIINPKLGVQENINKNLERLKSNDPNIRQNIKYYNTSLPSTPSTSKDKPTPIGVNLLEGVSIQKPKVGILERSKIEQQVRKDLLNTTPNYKPQPIFINSQQALGQSRVKEFEQVVSNHETYFVPSKDVADKFNMGIGFLTPKEKDNVEKQIRNEETRIGASISKEMYDYSQSEKKAQAEFDKTVKGKIIKGYEDANKFLSTGLKRVTPKKIDTILTPFEYVSGSKGLEVIEKNIYGNDFVKNVDKGKRIRQGIYDYVRDRPLDVARDFAIGAGVSKTVKGLSFLASKVVTKAKAGVSFAGISVKYVPAVATKTDDVAKSSKLFSFSAGSKTFDFVSKPIRTTGDSIINPILKGTAIGLVSTPLIVSTGLGYLSQPTEQARDKFLGSSIGQLVSFSAGYKIANTGFRNSLSSFVTDTKKISQGININNLNIPYGQKLWQSKTGGFAGGKIKPKSKVQRRKESYNQAYNTKISFNEGQAIIRVRNKELKLNQFTKERVIRVDRLGITQIKDTPVGRGNSLITDYNKGNFLGQSSKPRKSKLYPKNFGISPQIGKGAKSDGYLLIQQGGKTQLNILTKNNKLNFISLEKRKPINKPEFAGTNKGNQILLSQNNNIILNKNQGGLSNIKRVPTQSEQPVIKGFRTGTFSKLQQKIQRLKTKRQFELNNKPIEFSKSLVKVDSEKNVVNNFNNPLSKVFNKKKKPTVFDIEYNTITLPPQTNKLGNTFYKSKVVDVKPNLAGTYESGLSNRILSSSNYLNSKYKSPLLFITPNLVSTSSNNSLNLLSDKKISLNFRSELKINNQNEFKLNNKQKFNTNSLFDNLLIQQQKTKLDNTRSESSSKFIFGSASIFDNTTSVSPKPPKPSFKFNPEPILPKPTPKEPTKIVPTLFGGNNKVKDLKGGFIGLVKTKGKFKQVTEKSLSYKDALSKTAEVVDNTTARSFKIKKVSETPKTILNLNSFNINKYYRKKSGVWVEKNNSAIDTLGEKQGITVQGWIANKNKNNIFKRLKL